MNSTKWMSAMASILASGAILALAFAPAIAQVSSAGTTGQQEEVVKMSRFEVTTTQDHGYVATNSASAFKTNQQLLDIPQMDVVISSDLIKDINSTNITDIISYFGATSGYANSENMKVRGYSIQYAYTDEMPANCIFEDNSWVDTYEIIKGPAQMFYLNSSLSGVVLKSTKKPLPYKQNIVTTSVNSNGLFRATFDSTAPLGTLGDAKIGYRVVGANQRGNMYFDNYSKDITSIYAVLQADWKNTTARFAFMFENITTEEMFALVTPSGDLWTGAGRKCVNFPPHTMDRFQHYRYMGQIFTRIGDNWENKVKFSVWHLNRFDFGSASYTTGYDWNAKTVTIAARENSIKYAHWCFIDDVQGHYSIGPFKNIDIFGGGYDEYTIRQAFYGAANLPSTIWTNQTVSMYSRDAVNNIKVPTWQVYDYYIDQGVYANANAVSHNTTPVFNVYWQHSIDIVPNYVSLSGGYCYTGITPETITNVRNLPWQATVVPQNDMTHRLGVVVKPIKDVAFYWLNATTLTAQTQGALLANGLLAPPQEGTDTEFGMKTAFFGGKLSIDVDHYKMTQSNGLLSAGALPNGQTYFTILGTTTQEGWEGTLQLALVPGWQVVGSWLAGHMRDPLGRPVSTSYDNAWSLFTRYDFQARSPLHGLAIGAGVNRVGGRWVTTSGITGVVWNDYTNWAKAIKMKTGTQLNGFVSYVFNKHWSAKLDCANILNETWAQGILLMYTTDPSFPRYFTLETDYKF